MRDGAYRNWSIGGISGFDLTEAWPDRRPAPALVLLRTGFEQPIDLDRETMPAGIQEPH